MLILSVYVLTLLFFLSLVGLTRQRQDQTSITSLLVIEKMLCLFSNSNYYSLNVYGTLLLAFVK